MKLLIEIPDNVKIHCDEGILQTIDIIKLKNAVAHGKPLDEVLDKIRAEINKLPDLNPDYEMDKTIHVSKWAVHGIIDKYKAERR